MRRRDVIATLFLAALVVATRLPFRTQYLFTWDSVNFAFALQGFDVRQHAPHPPGYPCFMAAAKLLQMALGEANTAYVTESILFSALAVVALYLLGAAIYGRPTGLVAALFLAFSVTFWSYGEVALSYTALPFFNSLVALLAYRILFQGQRLLPWLAVAYSVGGGFRPELMLFLAPLLVAALYRQPLRDALFSLAIAGFVALLWLVPTIQLSGGLGEYWAVFSAYMGSDVIGRYAPTHRGLEALAVNLRDTASYTFYALYAISLPVLGGTCWLLARQRLSQKGLLLLLWAAPAALFYVFVHIGDPGYVFGFLPALLLATARFLTATSPRGVLVAVVAAVLLANSGVFLLHQRPLTAWGLRRQDALWQAKTGFIAQNYQPDEVLLLSYESYKHLRYYLPQCRNVFFIDIASPTASWFPLPEGVRYVVLADESLARLADEATSWEAQILILGATVYHQEVSGQRGVVFDGRLRLMQ